jgi:hypothetical protein
MAETKKYERKKKYPNFSLQRRLQVYPPPKYFGLFSAFVKANEMKESEAASLMIRVFFDAMTPDEKLRLRMLAEERNI